MESLHEKMTGIGKSLGLNRLYTHVNQCQRECGGLVYKVWSGLLHSPVMQNLNKAWKHNNKAKRESVEQQQQKQPQGGV